MCNSILFFFKSTLERPVCAREQFSFSSFLGIFAFQLNHDNEQENQNSINLLIWWWVIFLSPLLWSNLITPIFISLSKLFRHFFCIQFPQICSMDPYTTSLNLFFILKNSNTIFFPRRTREKNQNHKKKKKNCTEKYYAHIFFLLVFFVSTLLLSSLFFQLINKYIQIERIKKKTIFLPWVRILN